MQNAKYKMQNAPKKIVILGSTGSIGTQAVEIVLRNPDRFQVVALSTHSNSALIKEQAQKLNCKNILVTEKEGIERLPSLLDIEADIVLNALVGAVGLEATIITLKKNKLLALANKESLVAGGEIINKHFREKKKNIIPVDSEHSAIFQLLLGEQRSEINNIFITASGGPFRNASVKEMKIATPDQALAHPRWKMGPKITIDSATMVNKGLEVMEAHYLFDMPYDKIKVIIHPQSIIHSMVQFIDGSIKAHLGPTDMRIPIQYALSHPRRFSAPVGFEDLIKLGTLNFEPADFEKFKALPLAYEAGRKRQGYPVVFNAANEIAVAAFLSKEIDFTTITDVIDKVMQAHTPQRDDELEAVKEIDEWARTKAGEICFLK